MNFFKHIVNASFNITFLIANLIVDNSNLSLKLIVIVLIWILNHLLSVADDLM